MGKSDIDLDQANFLKGFLTENECKVHQFEAVTKRLSMQLKYPSLGVLKKSKVSYICRKFDGHIHLIQKILCLSTTSKMVTPSMEPNFRGGYERLSRRKPRRTDKSDLVHQVKAPAHKVSMATVRHCSFELGDHPYHYLDFAIMYSPIWNEKLAFSIISPQACTRMQVSLVRLIIRIESENWI